MTQVKLIKKAKKNSTQDCKGYGKKQGSCTNKAVDSKKSPYCRNCAGISFEFQVGRLFSIQGYEVLHNLKVSSTQNDFFAKLQYGIANIGILVECKWKFDESDSVNGQDVRKFYGTWDIFNKKGGYGRADKAFLITNAKFAPEAIEVAKDLDIELLTEYQFIKNIMNFEPYLKQLVHKYEKSHLYDHYIEIESIHGIPISDEINYFIDDLENEAIVILGDYGTGKTSFCSKFSADLAAKVLNGEDAPLPILIQLRDYNKAFDMEQLITNFLINKCKIPNGNFETFLQLLEYGYLILIFDGFDEIARRVDYATKYKVFTEICRFSSESSKVVVTCRPNFFNHKDEYESIFKESPLHFEPNVKTTSFTEIRIRDLSQDQIEEYILSYSQKLSKHGFEVEEFLKTIEDIHDLSDLAKRPVLLNIIVETVPQLLLEKEKTKINAASLYEKYTNFWVQREDGKGKTLIKAHEKKLFSQELAWKMFNKNLLSIHYKDLPNEIKDYFKINSTDDLDHFSHDIKTCSFLNNDDEGEFKFIHKSFLEYFAAVYIIENLSLIGPRESKKLNDLLGKCPLSMEVGFFIRDLIQIKKIKSQKILDVYNKCDKTKLTNTTRNNLLSIVSKTGTDISGYLDKLHDIRGTDLSYCSLENITFKKRSLLGVHLHGATLKNVKFIRCELTDNIFKNAILSNVLFSECDLETSDFSKSKISSCDFLYTNLAKSKLYETTILDSDFYSSDLTEVEANILTNFTGCKNLDTTIGLPYELTNNVQN